jgi:trehalose-phosphatase
VKPASVALHWRGAQPAEVETLERWCLGSWGALEPAHGLKLHTFDGGLELRAPGHDKGTAVRTVLAESPPGTVAAYLGDDLTDEDAFRALPEGCLGVLVRPELRNTAATTWLRPPQELLAFLDRWAAIGSAR